MACSCPLVGILRRWEILPYVHLCYVDDSGDSRSGTILSALLVEPQHWAGLLDVWLGARREIHRLSGVAKTRELHANALYKRRGSFCTTPAREAGFGTSQRAAVGRIMLSAVGKFEHVQVVTIASAERSTPVAYARLIG
jgi:hypothetical protein